MIHLFYLHHAIEPYCYGTLKRKKEYQRIISEWEALIVLILLEILHWLLLRVKIEKSLIGIYANNSLLDNLIRALI